MKILISVNDIIDQLGGSSATADLCGVGVAAVSVWRVNNMIPAHSYPIISEKLLKKGFKPRTSLFRFERKKYTRKLRTVKTGAPR
jgi:hypothetical protein